MPFSFAAGTLLPGSFRLFRCYAVLFAFVVAVVLPAVSQSQTIRYIKPVASGDGTGSSWANASANLKAMMDTAPANSQVWVAAGTYYPTTGTDRNVSFVLKNQVAVYGGFAGTETTLAQRSGGASILSGNIGDPANNGDNSFHVIYNSNSSLNNTAIIDGFTVSGGNANSSSTSIDMIGGGYVGLGGAPVFRRMIFEQNYGITQAGGIFISSSNLLLDSCIIRQNQAGSTGGGMVVEGGSPVLQRCHIFQNNAGNNTGGIMLTSNSTPTLTDCIIEGNSAAVAGGVFIRVSAKFTRCFIIGNTATGSDAAFTITAGVPVFEQCVIDGNNVSNATSSTYSMSINAGSARFLNCHFTRNNNGNFQGRLLFANGLLGVELTNCLLVGNTSPLFATGGVIPPSAQAGFSVTYCVGSASIDGATNAWGNIYLVNFQNPAGPDGRWGTPDDGIIPQPCSLPLDRGIDSVATYATDITGRPRKVKTKAFAQSVDAGAYEVQEVCAPTGNRLYVLSSSLGAQSGNSWDDAFRNLDDALTTAKQYPAVTEIWVGQGTYTPTRGTDRNASFGLRNNLAIYGGFAGTETNLSQRNIIARRCTLSGNIGDAASNADNSFHIVTAAQDGLNNTAILDGFTIREGRANNGGSDGGGGMRMVNGNPLIRNCNFLQNYGVAGGAVCNINAAPSFTNCVFSGNNASVGGVMYCEGGGQVVVQQSVITGNSAISGGVSNTYEGGGISYINCTIHNNSASYYGVCYTAFSGAYFTNCIIWGNSSFAGEDEGGATGVSYSLLSFPYGGANNKVGDPNFSNAVDPDGNDNSWGTTDDGLRLGNCSQAANMGNDVWMALTLDFKGQARKFGVVDAGAYEAQVLPYTAIYVRSSGAGDRSGSSWSNAMSNLNTALSTWTNCPTADSLLVGAQVFTANSTNVFEVNKPGGIMIGNYDPSTGQRLPGYNAYLYGDLILRTPIRMEAFIIFPKP